MRIDAPEGTKVKYLNKNGYPGDKTLANMYLKEGQIYTVDFTVAHSWGTDLFLNEFIESFNSDMFEEVEDDTISNIQH